MRDGGRGPDADDGDERRYPASRLRPSGVPGSGLGDEPGVGAEPGPGLGPGVGPGLDDPLGEPAAPLGRAGSGRPGGSLFAPKSFAGGKVQVFGCAPGFLIVSLVLSLLLTLILNALL